MRVLVIVPAYNEERNLPGVLRALHEHAPFADVCVVDDGSSDATAEVAASHGATVLQAPINLGIGGAMQTGYLWAQRRGYDAAVQIDGDGQHDPRFIPAALAPLRDGVADVVIGSRFLGEDAGGFRSTAARRAGIRYLCWLLRLTNGVRVTDPTSGFRATGRAAIALYAKSYPSDYPEPEAIAVAQRSGLRVVEVPVRMAAREHGESSIGTLGALYYFVKVSLSILLLPGAP